MIGQLKFAWIDFRRSFLGSLFTFISQIITYSAITISIGLFSLMRANLQMSLDYVYFSSYMLITIFFIVVCIIIGIIVTIRSIDLKFQSQKDDIAIMKNVGGKSRWIYSYFIFNQILTAVIMLLLGIILGLIVLVITSVSFGFGSIFSYVGFLPILAGNLAILVSSYLKAHYIILKFISEKDFEISSSSLSNYKSIFEFDAVINKFSSSVKLGVKNFLRSGKVLTSLLFSFFLIFASISFVLGPLTVTETHYVNMNNRFQDYSYVVGSPDAIDFFNQSLPVQEYSNSSYTGLDNDLEHFYNTSISTQLLTELEGTGVTNQKYFISKLQVQELSGYEILNDIYLPIGQDRKVYATIIGYEDISFEEEEYIAGINPNPSKDEVLIGDSLEAKLFDNSTLQKLKLHDDSNQYKISGVVIDSFAAGYSIYCPLNKLIAEGVANGTNLLMLENVEAAVYDEISEILEGYGYQIVSMEKMIEQSLVNYNNFTNMFKVLGGVMFAIFSFQVIVYSFLYFITYRKDFELLYRLGIKKKRIYGAVITAILLQIIPGIALGSYFGAIIGRYFLVPNAILSNFAVIIIAVIVGFILIATTASIYASKKGLEKVIK
ncbi:MAG: hypothetical protein KAX32_10100 [Candidatus Heimdallarchaeota archaeon]|nr:hypothetical protein [Candidatus Heimdallarchaeota archaeon]